MVESVEDPRSAVAVIPARWASTRFPGKIVAPLAGRPVLAHVIERVSRARRVGRVLVATDDERIARVASDSGVQCAMTRPDHASGSDRIAEAIAGLRRGPDTELILNVQGDEPLVDPAALDLLVAALDGVEAATLAVRVPVAEGQEDPNAVKVVRDAAGFALYFSRAAIPGAHPGGGKDQEWLRHLGVYAWRRDAFDRFVAQSRSKLEIREGLEQLRWLEMGGRMQVEIVESAAPGVDTPEDLARCEALLAPPGPQV